jgi:hypothetical protein
MGARFGVQILEGPREFSLIQNIQTGSVGCPASYTRGTTVLHWKKSGLGVKLTTHLNISADGKNEWHYTSTPPLFTHGAERKTFPLLSFTLINIITTVCDNIM